MDNVATRLARAFTHYGNPIELLAQRALKPTDFRVVDRRTGVRCYCASGSYVMFSETFHYREYDVPKMPIRPGDVVIDVGANHGFFTCYAAYQGARVLSFEPTAETHAQLIRNLQINGLSDRVVANPWAIGAEDGEIELLVTAELGGGRNTTIRRFAERANIDIKKRRLVPCRTLPSVWKEFGIDHVRLLKLDCEGAELDILRTLSSSHVEQIDALVAEYHAEAYDVSELLGILLGWGTHQVTFAEEKAVGNAIVRAVSNSVLNQIAAAL
jgi:FkbM family methyltransferase